MSDGCGCGTTCGCAASAPATPEPVENAPGLSSISYRVAHHGTTKEAILRGLADHDLPALSGLGARDDADLSIALADGFAAMADVLTFYTERIAVEHYLRTATERLSVVELSRLIGYRPDPGVAADAWLAFTVEEPVTVPHTPPPPVQVPVGTQVQSVPGQDEAPVTFETVAAIEARAEHNAVVPVRSSWPTALAGRTLLNLAGTGHRLQRGDVLLLLGAQRHTDATSSQWAARTVEEVVEDSRLDSTRVSWGAGLPSIPVAGVEVHVFRLRSAIFGHNAPDPRMLAIPTANLEALVDTGNWTWKNFGLATDQLDLDQVHPQVVVGGWALVCQGSAQQLARVDGVTHPSPSSFGVSGKATRITLDATLDTAAFDRRSALVLAQSEELPLAADPVTTAVAGDVLDLAAEVPLLPGQPLAVAGPLHGAGPDGEELSEVVLVADTGDAVTVGAGTTTVRLAHALLRSYDRALTTVNANVAPATEGASVGHILGNGDARVPGQWFPLHHRPMTWLATASSREPALEVRVEEVAWQRRETLFGAGPQERCYVVETADDGTTVVRFGDGVEGARLPTGQANVRVRYRTGLGSAGNVRTGQLTTLLSRPLGIASVLNPAPGAGGEAPEVLDEARRNAPVTVRTLDRVVSRLDAEDFARAQPGVLKASATWVPHGPLRGLVLTLTGPDGAAVDESVPTHGRVLAALRDHGDERLPVHLLSYSPVALVASLKVLPAADHQPDRVLADVRRELLAAFGLRARELGQPTSLDEVVEVAHRAPGVLAVDVDVLRRADAPSSVVMQHPVPAHPGGLDPAGTGVLAAELLSLSDAGLHLEVMA